MKRRTLLAAMCGTAVAAAGCLADEYTEDGGDDDENPGDGNPSLERVETIATRCGDPDDDWVVAIDEGGTIRVVGVTPAPNPCHEATASDVTIEDGVFSVSVDVVSTLGADEDCIQCHGAIDYELRIAVGDIDLHSVRVDHRRGESHTTEPVEGDAYPELVESSIETVDTECATGDDDRVQADRSSDRFEIDGRIPASTPCHRALIDAATVDDRELIVEIGLESTLAEDESCIQCLGRISYRASLEVRGAHEIERLTVKHADGGTHVVEWERETEGT